MESVKKFLENWLKKINDVVPIPIFFDIISFILFAVFIFAGVWLTWYVAVAAGREIGLIFAGYHF